VKTESRHQTENEIPEFEDRFQLGEPAWR